METPSAIPSNMVMIDQAQLMELLAAKQTLDAQKAAAATPGATAPNAHRARPPQLWDGAAK